ncbi:PDZ domain-containing protein 2 [Macrosteles quadrilineatus]|uniref:PDZ domain-containing protein 2 n=1 Tax=Macrosteles quadrilineatus TaxID=74068 RepID=UPI0023E2F44F|nr:PDZ domain-containing protein 2 [Macrosteles quadrilineatus]
MSAEAPLEVRHKGQQSADSGAYLEWTTESADVERNFQSNVTGEFVTVVAVETQQPPLEDHESSFVTVLAIGDKKEAEEVLVYRLPGERLGFGLKFEGGLKTAERVNRLFIQSCAPDSPASRTRCSWGPLVPGDEILEIDGVEVKSMTRIDCVRSLKESNVVIKLKVKQHGEEKESKNSPPPIPPRKVPRRNSAQKEAAIVHPPDGFTDESKFKSVSPKARVKNNHDERQIPEAEVYLDLISKESEILLGESESDDTGSSISTVVDRLSSAPTTSNSSFSDVRSITSLDITTPPTPTTNTCPTFDLDRVLEPFLQLEREFSSSANIDESSLFNKLVAAANFTEPSHISLTRSSSMNSGAGEDSALQPPVSFQDEPGNRANFDGERMPLSSAEIFEPIKKSPPAIKAIPRKSHNIVLNLCSDDVNSTDNQNDKSAPELPPKPTPRKELNQKNKFKSGKKRPPPPPPPRSDRPLCPDPQVPEDTRSEVEDCRNDMDHHLPRLIDFVPKDRTDLVVPNAIHPENSQQNHMELLIQRQRLLEMMSPQNVSDLDKEKEEDVGSDASEGEEHCPALPMCVPVVESDEETETFVPSRSANLTTIGEDEEEEVFTSPPVPTIQEPSVEDQDEDKTNEEESPVEDADTEPISTTNVQSPDDQQAASPEKLTETVECGAMDVSASATLNLSPPPSFSRLPPDGHEFPPNYQELCPELMAAVEPSLKMQPPPPLPSTAPPIPKKKFSVPILEREIETTTPARKYSTCSNPSMNTDESSKPSRAALWRNDEKSVRSVRDKIAMFSNVADETPVSPAIPPPSMTAHRKLNRFKSSEDVLYNDNVDGSGNLSSGKLFSRSVISVDKVTSNSYLPEINQRSTSPMKKLPTYSSMVDMSQVSALKQAKSSVPKSLELTSRTQSSMDLSSSSSAYSSESPDSSLTSSVINSAPYIGYSSTLPRKTAARDNERKISLTSSSPITNIENKTNLGRALSFNSPNKLHSRSQSLVDVNSIPLNRYMPKTSNNEEARRASLNALIEQRRRSISKLRGLVIPEKVSEDVVPQTIPDLPEIKSRDSILSKVPEENVKKSSFSSYGTCRYGNSTFSSPTSNITPSQNSNLSSLSWKSQPPVADIPKYSPAFKRKSLAVYGAPSLASSVSSSLSSSREELRPIFDNTVSTNIKPLATPPSPPSKPPRSVSNVSRNSFSSPTATSLSPTPSHQEPPKSLESITSPTQSDLSFEFISSSGSSPDMKMMRNNHYEEKINQNNGSYIKSCEPQVMPLIKLNKQQNANDLRRSGGEESDNDSAVSSSRSSISHDFSPPQSPLPDLQHRIGDDDHMSRSHMLLSPSNSAGSSDRRTLRRTLSSETTASAASSTASTLTSGSQASCSSSSTDSLNRRVLKAQSVEAINRKNVLSSARFSSGQDLKIGSPLIQRKFEEGEGYLDEGVLKVDMNETKTHIETENFIEKLNGTLKKEIVTEDLCEENNAPDIIHYQLLSDNKEFRHTKVAYLEVEVSDGGNFSSQEDSSFIDSNPSSMEHLDSDPIPAPRDKILSKENGYMKQEIFMTDNVDGKMNNFKHVSKFDTITADFYNENIVNNSPNKKPFVKRLSRETIINNNSSTSDDDSCKTALSQSKLDNCTKPKLVSTTTPKPAERKSSSQTLLHSDSKESTTSSEDFVSCTSKQETPTLSPKESPGSSSTGRIPTVSSRNGNSRRSVSVNDIRKAFEKAEIALSGKPKTGMLNGNGHLIPSHARVSSLDSTTSEDSCAPTPTHYGSVTNLQKEQQFGSITSLASSTSLISQQELQQLIDDANQTLEEAGGCSHEVVVVILHRDTAGGSVGITLAGGADYEAKEITVHKVLAGSPADRDGRIQKGDRILSINGRSMKGVSHRESLAILKAPRPEVVLVVSRWRPDGPTDDPLVLGLRNNLRPPRIPEQHPDDPASPSVSDKDESVEEVARGPPLTVTLVKDGAGLGFSLEGGKDSPLGDQPLTIKKIFTGGCAEKSGQLFAGDELLSVNGTDVTSMSRIEAWGLMKRLADGKVVLNVRHKTIN